MRRIDEPDKRIADMKNVERTIDNLSPMYFSRLMALSDIVNRYVSIALKDEVNWLRLRALVVLTGIGKGTITPTELAANLLRPNQNVTKIVDGLERDGLVKKLREPGDRRMITIRITNGGLDYIRQSLEKIALAEKELRFCLGKGELEAIGTLLTKIRGHMVGLLRSDPHHLKG